MVQGYCMKEKKMVDILNAVEVQNKRGLKMAKGVCACGCKLCRILGK